MLKKNVTVILLFSMAAFSLTPKANAEMPGFYASAQLGWANSHMHTTNLVNITNASAPLALPGLNNLALAYHLSFGYQFDQHWAIEFAYRHFSHANTQVSTNNYLVNASSKESAFDLVGKSIVPLSNKLNVYAKLGIAYLRPNSNGYASAISPYNASANSYSSSLEPTFGLGISYALKPNVPVEFSWNRIQKLGGSNHAPSSDFYALGVSYYFG